MDVEREALVFWRDICSSWRAPDPVPGETTWLLLSRTWFNVDLWVVEGGPADSCVEGEGTVDREGGGVPCVMDDRRFFSGRGDFETSSKSLCLDFGDGERRRFLVVSEAMVAGDILGIGSE